jgi:exodeoxyribonuclease V alpha subunit
MIQDIDQYFGEFFPKPLSPYASRLSQSLREGHVCIPVSETENAHLSKAVPKQFLYDLSPKDSPDNIPPVPFISSNGFLYLQRYYRYETQIVHLLKQRIQSGKINSEIYRRRLTEHKELIQLLAASDAFGKLNEDERIDWQLIAVIRTLMNDFSIITGGPGTGKTTTLAKFLRVLYTLDPSSKVAIAAPTGKASMRMMESLRERTKDFPDTIVAQIQKLKPYTLHRLLGYKSRSIYFKHNEENPIPFDWVVVDEASMIDMPMFAKFLAACQPSTRILLLGDKDQLASVEAGSLLGDLCQSAGKLNRFSSSENEWINTFIPDNNRNIPAHYANDQSLPLAACITELRLSRRFQQSGDVGKLSLSLIRGEVAQAVDLLQSGSSEMVQMISSMNDDKFAEFIKDYYVFMQEEDTETALNTFNKLRVLVTVKEGASGLYAVNKLIEQILHASRPDLIKPDAVFYHNRPVIITQNNYELGLFNGDTGIVRRDPDSQQLRVYFEETEAGKPLRSFNPAYLNHCETVFAMTIHKSQGSEFGKVMVVLPDIADNPLLTRELLYTGVTRSSGSVLICGSKETLEAGIERRVVRISGIPSRMNPNL